MSDLKKLFFPKSVAIIGATDKEGKVGYAIAKNMKNFKGKIFFVNPKHEKIFGKKCYNTVKDIKEKIDVAVIAVPKKAIFPVLDDCIKKEIRFAIIITAGFGEIGKKEEEEKLKKYKKKIRIVGPNCIGILNNQNGLNVLFYDKKRMEFPKKGNITFITQSGAIGGAVLEWCAKENIGINMLVSYGNGIDLNEKDFLEYFDKEKNTEVIIYYIEGAKKPKGFVEALKKVKKPIIFLKGGKTGEGKKAVSSHTASLAGKYEIYKTLFKQFKKVEVESLKEMFNVAKLFLFRTKIGKKVCILTSGGGYGVIATDQAKKNGFELSKIEIKKEEFPEHVIVSNPFDLTGDADVERFEKALKFIDKEKDVDFIFLIPLLNTSTINPSALFEVLKKHKKNGEKDVVIFLFGGKKTEEFKKKVESIGIPCYDSIKDAFEALKKYGVAKDVL